MATTSPRSELVPRGRLLRWSAPAAPIRSRWWSRLVQALTHQHDHVTLVERAIVTVMGEDYGFAVRRCHCGHEAPERYHIQGGISG